MNTTSQPPKIVAFVSYKGGVGRSLTLVNVAYALAREGKRVGCIDFDLDAPGLNLLFDLNLSIPDALAMGSLMLSSRILDTDKAIIDVPSKGSGAIYLLPATYQPEIVEKIEWTKSGTLPTLREICKRFAELKQLDLILIDYRAGAGKASGLGFAIANLLICVFRIDRQSLEGTKKMDKPLKAQGKSVLYLPSMVPNLKKATTILREVKKSLALETAIPYSSSQMIDEKVIMRDSPKSQTAKIYSSLTKRILNNL
ncbi:MAG: AAA family ATPase [Nitrospirota bacterium]